MKRLALKYSILSALGLILAFSAGAQIQSGEVDIIKQFNARLADAERFVLAPKLPPLDTSSKAQAYNLVNRPIKVQYLPPRITPKTLQNEPKEKIYNGYVRAGAGFPQALLLEGSYDFIGKENADFGIDFRHQSANNTKKVENQRFADNDFGVFGSYHAKDQGFTIGGNLNYSRDFVHFYGYNDLDDDFPSELSFAQEDVKQRFSTISGKAKLYNSVRTAGDINYSAAIDFYALEDLYAARENGFNLEFSGAKWFDDKHPLSVTLRTDFTNYRDSAKQTLNNIFLNPSYAFHGDRFRVKIGLNVASHKDQFYLYPNLELSANILDNLLTAFAGAEGGLQKNNFRSLTDYNPFLSSRIRVRNSFYNNYFGGIKGEFKGVTYRAQAVYKTIDNLALFLTDGDSIPRFNVLYDTASIVTVSAELNTELIEGLVLSGSFSQHFFSLENQEKPWHLPSLTVNAGLAYSGLIDNLTVKGELFMQNGVPVKGADGKPKNLNTLLDLSLGAEYQLSDGIGAFVQVNNVLNNRWQRWQHYPTFGLNAMAGISARF